MRAPRETCSECSGVLRSGAAGACSAASPVAIDAASGGCAVSACASAACVSLSGAWVMTGSAKWTRARATYPAEPPLSRNLRDFVAPSLLHLPHLRGGRSAKRIGKGQLTPSVSSASRRRCFPELHPPAVLLPERFRGGCAFGVGL